MIDTLELETSKTECNCTECAALQAKLEMVTEWLEDLLESATLGGWVQVGERQVDDMLGRLV